MWSPFEGFWGARVYDFSWQVPTPSAFWSREQCFHEKEHEFEK